MSALEKESFEDMTLDIFRTEHAIDKAVSKDYDAKDPRGHLGMSSIGNPDTRTLWLKFRWSLPDKPNARTLRIFNLGNIIEDEVVRLLRLSDFQVWEKDPATGKQFNFKRLGGHFAGSSDGVIKGIPESKQTHLLEIKSAKESKFKELKQLRHESVDHNTALKKWNPDYFGQCQCYMSELELKRSLFVVYNKDTSEILSLRIKPEAFYFEGALAKAERIIEATTPPQSSYPNRNWFEIKNYKSEEYQRVYWGDALPPKANCRNCRSCTPVIDQQRTDAAWVCSRDGKSKSIPEQLSGCTEHNFLPALMPANLIEVHESANAVEYEAKDGTRFFNAGEQDHAERVFSSRELIVMSEQELSKKTLDDPITTQIRAEFKGRLIDIEEV